MGLGNSTRKNYLSIVDGKIAKRFKEPVPGVTTTRTTNTGKVIHEQYFDHLSGFITDIKKTTHETFGDFLNIEVVDGEESFMIQCNFDSGYSTAFFKTLPNVDFSSRLTIIPSMKMEGDKKKVTLFVSQNGKALKHAYTKDNPNGMPLMEKKIVRGKEMWDNWEMMKFFLDNLENNIIPKLQKAAGSLPSAPQAKPADERPKIDTINSDQYDDDLPF
jgi:hypothetical protein